MNNLSNQEYLFLNKKWNDISSVTSAIWVHQPAGKAAAVQAKVTDEKFVKSFDCFATSFRSFHFVSFEASECKWIKGRIKGIFFKISTNENTELTVTSSDFPLWIYRMCLGNWHVTAMNKKCDSLKVVAWMKKFINYQVN